MTMRALFAAILLTAPIPASGQAVTLNGLFEGADDEQLGVCIGLSDDGTVLAFNGRSGGTQHVYFARRTNGTWTVQGGLPIGPSLSTNAIDVDPAGDQVIASDRIYQWNGTSWALEQDLLPGMAARCAINGDLAVVVHSGSTAEPFFQSAPGSWGSEGAFSLPNSALDLQLVDSTLFVGTGSAVEVYQRTGSFPFASWSFVESIPGVPGTAFGQVLDTDNTHLVVGAPTSDVYGTDNGSAALYARDTAGSWTHVTNIFPIPFPASTGHRFGGAVTLNWPLLGVGAYGTQFRTYVFAIESAGTTAHHCQAQTILPPVSSGIDVDFGAAVLLRNDTLVSTDPFYHATGSSSNNNNGRIYIYDVDRSGMISPSAAVYCTGKTNSLSCVPFISTTGVPSATDSNVGFVITAEDVLPGEPGFLFYGLNGRLNLNFHGGKLCVKTPLVRLFPPTQAKAIGSPPCKGVLDRGLNKRIQSGVDPQLTAGQRVYAQWFLRDPQDPLGFGDSFTDAIEFVICN